MSKKRLTRILIIAGVILIVFLLIAKSNGWIGKTNAIKVSTEKVTKRNITEFITANGKIQPEIEVKISPDVSGEIVELNVVEGQSVEEGDLLLKIKPDIYVSYLDQAKAALNTAKSNRANSIARKSQIDAQFVQAELSYKRNKKLWDQKAISEAEWENAVSNFEVAKAEVNAAEESINAAEYSVKSSEASLKEAKENLQKTTIYAPVGGTISVLNVEKGERVVGTMQMAGTEILRVANLDQMEVKVEVNENDIIRVNLGDTAIIEIDAYLDEKFKGIVTEIANSATILGAGSDQLTNFDVKIRILKESYSHLNPENNPDYYPFRPGMSATVDILTHTEYGILSIPIQAVTTRSDTSKTDKKSIDDQDKLLEVVFVIGEENKVKQVTVETGIQDSDYIYVKSGLKEDEQVVTAPYSAISRILKEGKNVEVVEKDKLFTNND